MPPLGIDEVANSDAGRPSTPRTNGSFLAPGVAHEPSRLKPEQVHGELTDQPEEVRVSMSALQRLSTWVIVLTAAAFLVMSWIPTALAQADGAGDGFGGDELGLPLVLGIGRDAGLGGLAAPLAEVPGLSAQERRASRPASIVLARMLLGR